MTYQNSRITFLFLIAILLMAACGNVSTPTPTPAVSSLIVLKASGSGTITTVLEAIKPAFESATPGYKLEVLSGSSTGNGVTGILEGILDIATMARSPKDEEIAKNIKYYEMGLVGQAIIVNSSLANITSLSSKQIADIFSGKITNWSEVGGPNQKIVLYVREEDETSTKALRKVILGDTPFPETATTLFSQSDMAFSVEGTPGAIGIAAWVAILATQTKVSAIAINGVTPDNASYPILGSAGIGYMTERESDIQPLISWLESSDGQAALKALGFVSNR
jgi:phosphate transport system substrate-binding protein